MKPRLGHVRKALPRPGKPHVCDFCERKENEVELMLERRDAYIHICNICVKAATEIMKGTKP